MEIKSRNTNTLQHRAYRQLSATGVPAASRNGPVIRFPDPVSVMLTNPWERVNLCPVRDANPFFHLWEALAMLGGLNDAAFMGFFAKNMLSYTDDGRRYNAFYGDRARIRWGDQLGAVITELRRNPDSRQAVVNLWDPEDLCRQTKDKACNLQLLFSVDQERDLINMTSTNRSNDAIFGGVTGANMVHLSLFHEYVALGTDRLGRDPVAYRLGPWWHVSNNLHVYTDNPKWEPLKRAAQEADLEKPLPDYPGTHVLFLDRSTFDRELHQLLGRAVGAALDLGFVSSHGIEEPFLAGTAVPMFDAWAAFKTGLPEMARDTFCAQINSPDWRLACTNWINRRMK